MAFWPSPRSPTKNVDLDESISFLDHVNLGCTQRDCKPNEIIIDPYREMFESPISAEATENYQGGKSLTQRRLRGPPTWKDMLENVLRGTASWQAKKMDQLCNVSSPCLDDLQVKKSLNQWEN